MTGRVSKYVVLRSGALLGQPKRSKMGRPEEGLHRLCADWLRAVLPPPPEGPVWTFVNNGMKRTKAEAGIAKALGQRAGWPDLNFIWNGRFTGFELKAPGRAAKPDKGAQWECQRDLDLAGGKIFNVNSFENFQHIVRRLAESHMCKLRDSG